MIVTTRNHGTLHVDEHRVQRVAQQAAREGMTLDTLRRWAEDVTGEDWSDVVEPAVLVAAVALGSLGE